jgi:hypothetical protein
LHRTAGELISNGFRRPGKEVVVAKLEAILQNLPRKAEETDEIK